MTTPASYACSNPPAALSGHRRRMSESTTRTRLIVVLAVAAAAMLAAVTATLCISIWSDWRSPEPSIDGWKLVSLFIVISLNPFAALGIGLLLDRSHFEEEPRRSARPLEWRS